MSGQATVQAQLEASLKATLLDLSRILAFQARLQQHGVVQYAPVAPRHLTQALQADAAQFAAICDHLEHRVLKAIATLERDARRAAGLSPARPTSPAPADPPAPVEPAKPAAPVNDDGADDAKLPFSLPTASTSAPVAASAAPPDAATMKLDLTLSPSPPPAASSTTTNSTLPFQLPGSSTLPASSSAMMLDLTGDDAAPPPAPAPTNVAPDLGGADANADLNALLASLNMPPFDNSLASTSLPSSSTAPAPSAPQPAPASTTFPALSLDALNALLAGSAPPPASTAPAPTHSSALDSLGLSLAPPAPSTVSAAPAPDLSSLDFSASSFGGFGGDAAGTEAGGGGGAAGGGGLGDGFDFTSFAAAPSGSGAGDASLEELLRSLGGGM
ncbi:hypothetical protein JCM3775_003826 [Rhodotorula graminis]